jgi:hypothetical protein
MSLRRTTSPYCIMLFTKLMPPIDRSGSPRCCLSALISSAMGRFTRRVFFQARAPQSCLRIPISGGYSDADFIGSGRRELCERLIGDSSHDYELGWSKMFAHPAVEMGTEITEVRRLVGARGEAIERDEEVREKFSHSDSSKQSGWRSD